MNLIVGLADGTNNLEEEKLVRQHIRDCDQCRVVFEGIRAHQRMKLVGQRVGPSQRYEILAWIESGGMGDVYLATDTKLDRKIALKIVRPRRGKSNDAKRRLQEAKMMARLDGNPRVVHVLDIEEVSEFTGDERLAITMGYINGLTLRTWCAGRKPPLKEILRAFYELGVGLSDAHAKGVIHRDVKPTNVMVVEGKKGRFREIKITDFGLAKASEDLDPCSGIAAIRDIETSSSGRKGTPAYAAPEVHFGRRDVNELADQFSYCVALYEALYDKRPDVIRERHLQLPAVANRRFIPGWVRRMLARGLSVSQTERFPSMQELLAEFDKSKQRTKRTKMTAVTSLLALCGFSVFMFGWRSECRAPYGKTDDIWNKDTKAKIQAAFEASGAANAQDLFERMAFHFDKYIEQWNAQLDTTCRSKRLSPESIDERIRCLERQFYSAEQLVRKLNGHLSPKTVESSIDAVTLLPNPKLCHIDPEQYIISADDPALEEQILDLQRGVEQLKLMQDLGMVAASIAEAQKLQKEALEAGQYRLLARATIIEVELHQANRDLDESRRVAEIAKNRAGLSGDRDIFARALGNELYLYARGNEDLEKANRIAAEALEKSMMDRTLGEDAKAYLLMSVAGLRSKQGKGKEAIRLMAEVLEIRRGLYGSAHPLVGYVLQNYGTLLRENGNPAAALESHTDALAIFELTYGNRHSSILRAKLALANDLAQLDEVEAAEKLFEEALEISKGLYGPSPPLEGTCLSQLAEMARRQQKYEKSRELFGQALEVFRLQSRNRHSKTAQALLGLGKLEFEVGKYANARESFEGSIQILLAKPDKKVVLADAFFMLARTLVSMGIKSEANQKAEESLIVLKAQSSASAEALRDDIEKWLHDQGL